MLAVGCSSAEEADTAAAPETENKDDAQEPPEGEPEDAASVIGSWNLDHESSDSHAVLWFRFDSDGEVSLLGDPGETEGGSSKICTGDFDPDTDPVEFSMECTDISPDEDDTPSYSGTAQFHADHDQFPGDEIIQVSWDFGNVDFYVRDPDFDEDEDDEEA